MLLLKFSDRVGGVALQQRGVLPGQRFGQGGGGHELPMRAPSTSIMAVSLRAAAHPPYSKPSRVSSSGRAGPCITPSSVRCSIATTLLISLAPLYGYRRSCSYLLASVLWGRDLPTQGIIAQAWFSMTRKPVRFEGGFPWRVLKRPFSG